MNYNYRSLAPSLRTSCYNCLYFSVSTDSLNGHCRFEGVKSAIGIGTCDNFLQADNSNDNLPFPFAPEDMLEAARS